MEAFPLKQEIEALVADLMQLAEGYTPAADLDGYLSRVRIVAKAKEVARALVAPEQTPNYHGLNMAELIAIRTFMRLKVLDAIPKSRSISLGDLAAATGVQDSLLERMGRILVATGFLDQTPPRDGSEYKHTKFSLAYLVDDETPSPGHLFLAMYDDYFKHMAPFDDYLATHTPPGTQYREPDDPLQNPYTIHSGQPGVPVWEIMSRTPSRLRTFQLGMAGIDVAIPATGHFDFGAALRDTNTDTDTPEEDDNGTAVQLVDVGGGTGGTLRKILDAYPDDIKPGRVVLQDRKEVVELARRGGMLPEGVRIMEGDFMGVQTIRKAKAYLMRMILHDYADDVGIAILKNLAAAMSPASRVLVLEMVLPARVGKAEFAAAVMDQAVMTMGGKERTEDGFRWMFEAAGLELVRVWRAPGVPGGCVEGRLKR